MLSARGFFRLCKGLFGGGFSGFGEDEIAALLADEFVLLEAFQETLDEAAVRLEGIHNDAGAHRTFRRALLRALSKWRPADYVDNILENVELPAFQDREHASHPVNDADQLGIFLADDVLQAPAPAARDRVRGAREKTLKEIVKLQQRESGDD